MTTSFTAQTLVIVIRMDIDANGILHVEAEELNSTAKASYTVTNDQGSRFMISMVFFIIIIHSIYTFVGLAKEDIERHITFSYSDQSFLAPSGSFFNNI